MNNGYEIVYKKNNAKRFWKLFEFIKLKNPKIGSVYHPVILDYYFIRACESGYKIEDFSCVFTYNDVPFSAFVGAKFSKGLQCELNLFELPCLAIDLNDISLSKKRQIKSFLKVLLKLNFNKIQVKGPDLKSKIPIFGICYGLHILTKFHGGIVESSGKGEYGSEMIEVEQKNGLLEGISSPSKVWMKTNYN